MYSVESDFVTLLENQTYSCPNCACTTFIDNHFTVNSRDANEIIGSIWFASSFMQSHNLTRQANRNLSSNDISLACYPNPASSSSKISLTNSVIKEMELIDINGKQVWLKSLNESEFSIDNSQLPNGIYQIRVQDLENNVHQLKYVIIK